jgi:uncharacterized protein YjdB
MKASSSNPFILLSQYQTTVDIGDEFFLIAVTSNGKSPTWKSNDTNVASVNKYGKVTAKKEGSTLITVKIKDAEAFCVVNVNKTIVTINQVTASIERGEKLTLSATTSNDSKISWKSSRKSIATVDERGIVTGLKPGETIITASADTTSVTCNITIKEPTIQLSKEKITLYRGQTLKLSATTSSGYLPVWKTNRKSVAVVDENGTITAVKNGTAYITATLDGVKKSCEVIVVKPTISLSSSEITIKKGATSTLLAKVSSGNSATWSTSNINVVTVDSTGKITALKKGRAYVYAAEDGTKVKCTVYVTD